MGPCSKFSIFFRATPLGAAREKIDLLRQKSIRVLKLSIEKYKSFFENDEYPTVFHTS